MEIKLFDIPSITSIWRSYFFYIRKLSVFIENMWSLMNSAFFPPGFIFIHYFPTNISTLTLLIFFSLWNFILKYTHIYLITHWSTILRKRSTNYIFIFKSALHAFHSTNVFFIMHKIKIEVRTRLFVIFFCIQGRGINISCVWI